MTNTICLLNTADFFACRLDYELFKVINSAAGQAILIIDLSVARAEHKNKIAVGFRNHSDLIIVELGLSNFSLGNKHIRVFDVKGNNRFFGAFEHPFSGKVAVDLIFKQENDQHHRYRYPSNHGLEGNDKAIGSSGKREQQRQCDHNPSKNMAALAVLRTGSFADTFRHHGQSFLIMLRFECEFHRPSSS